MTVVRERRHQKALQLSVPPPIPSSEQPRWSSSIGPTSPDIESLSDLQKVSVIGQAGSNGIIYKVKHRKSCSVYALKVLRLHHDSSAFLCRQALSEAEIFKLIDSEFIVKCHAVFETSITDLCFVMEYMAQGSLHDALIARGERRRMKEESVSMIAWRVLRGLKYLYGMNIVHGDIKPSNLLINGDGHVKIADFGVGKIVEVGTKTAGNACMGTYAYMSPERVDPESWAGEEANGFPGDVWAVGVVVLECFVGRYPLLGVGEKADWAALIWAICFRETVELPEEGSPELRDFVGRCMERDWRKRATVEELLAHPFVNTASNLIGDPTASNQGVVDFV